MKFVKIKMKETAKGQDRNNEGIAQPVSVYEKGKIYRVSEVLAKAFVDQGSADAGKHEFTANLIPKAAQDFPIAQALS